MKTKILLMLVFCTEIMFAQNTDTQFKKVTDVTMSNDTLFVKGFKTDGTFGKYIKKMALSDVYTNRIITYRPQVSLLTLPIKIRPKTDDYSSSAYSGLDNIGINVDFISFQWNRYFSTGRNSSHRIGAGLLIAPAVEEMTAENTKNQVANNKQFFVTTGLAFNYSYNKLTFTVVPVGFDIATNSAGKEWIYNKKYWWGFGIGVDLKILETLFEKS
ncbi:hypothetical protein SAMN05421664_2601 [Chryseobacterium soldanellicola]|uniref:Outer membrane protein beta-barrel domain-containing protein n=1 Tax=Chryseobacterium soldanellicola TaxID=311333 RepID=A0A1H1DRS5_9FLAO|nr:hypothetical protein [Chryseobacterium soldanellicola]SDQ79050.1 hypothetical protein SAMN05421664_2601 [Chryseobacterium soldanellicola]